MMKNKKYDYREADPNNMPYMGKGEGFEIMSLVDIINKAIDALDEQDAEGHIWWNKFKKMVIDYNFANLPVPSQPLNADEVEKYKRMLTALNNYYSFFKLDDDLTDKEYDKYCEARNKMYELKLLP